MLARHPDAERIMQFFLVHEVGGLWKLQDTVDYLERCVVESGNSQEFCSGSGVVQTSQCLFKLLDLPVVRSGHLDLQSCSAPFTLQPLCDDGRLHRNNERERRT